MPEDELPQQAKDAIAFQKYQQKQYEEKQREQKNELNAALSEFSSFISELNHEQLDYVIRLVDEHGCTAVSNQLVGIAIAHRVFIRGLMVDGRSYEEAMGLDGSPEVPVRSEESVEKITAEQREVDEMLTVYATLSGSSLILSDYAPPTCSNCSTPYASIEDAYETAIRNDGCKGCQSKAKWG